jgi:hypothetical protein
MELAARVSVFSLSRRMGTSLAMIDATSGRLAADAERSGTRSPERLRQPRDRGGRKSLIDEYAATVNIAYEDMAGLTWARRALERHAADVDPDDELRLEYEFALRALRRIEGLDERFGSPSDTATSED